MVAYENIISKGGYMKKFFTQKINILILSLICMALWGSAFPSVKIGYDLLNIETADIFSKIYFAGLRFFLAGIMIFLLHRIIYKKRAKIRKEDIKYIALFGLIQTTIQYFFFYIGIANTTGIKSAILQSGSTFFTVIVSHFLYDDDKLNFGRILSLILGFAGVIFVNLGKDFDLNFKLIGEGFLLFTAIMATIGTIYGKSLGGRNINPFASSGGQMLLGSLPLILVGKVGMGGRSLGFTWQSILILFYLAFVSTTAFTIWYLLVQYNPPGEVSVYRLFIPVFGAIFSVLLLPGEVFTKNILIGLLLVIGGIVVLNIDSRKKVKLE